MKKLIPCVLILMLAAVLSPPVMATTMTNILDEAQITSTAATNASPPVSNIFVAMKQEAENADMTQGQTVANVANGMQDVAYVAQRLVTNVAKNSEMTARADHPTMRGKVTKFCGISAGEFRNINIAGTDFVAHLRI